MSLSSLSQRQLDEIRRHLVRFACIQLPDQTDLAEDLVQETFFSAYRAEESFKGEAHVKSWLFAILKNKIIDNLRQSRRQRAVFVSREEEMLDEAFDNLFNSQGHWQAHGRPSTWTSPEQSLNEKHFYAVLEACLYGLPENTARVFMMKEILGFDSAEVRTQCSLSAANYHTIMHRAREGLRQCLQIKWFNQG
ncbi:sigma-70 family RNA polymerase sigma factor [Neisseria yangbaofengii]|uniref:sigma-70 family RNA polymerase sigma factor n=1 Tax=Neisseria yangbaofengii TaxID=2709396 RepID=UPI0013ED8A16|nr:sigma-70 family RNA polymerase sigma factor [Neisseria yangbaofengii]